MSQSSKPPLPAPTKLQLHRPRILLNRQEQQSKKEVAAKRLYWLTPLALALSLSGCGLLCPATPGNVSQPTRPPSPPSLTQPIPSTTYSQSAANTLSSLKSVTGTSTTSKP